MNRQPSHLDVPMKDHEWAELLELKQLLGIRSKAQTMRTAVSRYLAIERLRTARDRQLLEEAAGEA